MGVGGFHSKIHLAKGEYFIHILIVVGGCSYVYGGEWCIEVYMLGGMMICVLRGVRVSQYCGGGWSGYLRGPDHGVCVCRGGGVSVILELVVGGGCR